MPLRSASVAASLVVALGLVVQGSASAAPPVLTVPGAQTVEESRLLEFTISAVDPDGQSVYLFATSLPPGATFVDRFDNTGLFSWTPSSSDVGSTSATFVADDSFGGTDTESVLIEVVGANQAPFLTPIADRSVERGGLSIVSLSGFDPDGDALVYSTIGLPSYGTLTDFGDGTGSLSFAPTNATPTGTTTVTVILSDGSLDARESFQVTVTSPTASNPPTLAPIGNRTIAEGVSGSFTVSATDPDGDPLTWSVSLPGFANFTVTGSAAGSSTGRVDLSPGFCGAGTYPASMTVSDGSLSDGETFTIQVVNVNRTPVWQVPSGSFALDLTAGSSATLSVSATDPDETCGSGAPALSVASSDAGSALTASLEDAGDGSGTLHVSSAAGGAGSFHVVIRATDAQSPALQANATVTITVREGTAPAVARAWAESDPLRLDIGKPRDRVYLEPVEGSFPLGSVALASIRLHAWEGSGSVESVSPMADRFLFGNDRDQNGVEELRMEFAKEDLRGLLSNVPGRLEAPLTLTASLDDGRTVSATLSMEVVPERGRAIRRLGPNPLNPDAILTVHLERDGRLRVRVFDLAGRLVRTLIDVPSMTAGEHELRFDGRDDHGTRLSSGRYFVRVEVPDGAESSALTILK